jgi:hypothetical protein
MNLLIKLFGEEKARRMIYLSFTERTMAHYIRGLCEDHTLERN